MNSKEKELLFRDLAAGESFEGERRFSEGETNPG